MLFLGFTNLITSQKNKPLLLALGD